MRVFGHLSILNKDYPVALIFKVKLIRVLKSYKDQQHEIFPTTLQQNHQKISSIKYYMLELLLGVHYTCFCACFMHCRPINRDKTKLLSQIMYKKLVKILLSHLHELFTVV